MVAVDDMVPAAVVPLAAVLPGISVTFKTNAVGVLPFSTQPMNMLVAARPCACDAGGVVCRCPV